MIQVFIDDDLIFDSRLQDNSLLELTATLSLDKAGTATLKMAPGHPAYNSFVSYKTVVTIYKDGVLRFRGRALYPSDDFKNCRTITCEGERGFFRDGVIRPYTYQEGPAGIFANVIELYNAQVEAFKQFVVGTVTVTDPNNYVNLESDKAEHFSDVLDKLVERCGGYIVFTTNESGQRVVNWLADVAYSNNQTIEFGENLLDFARTDESDELVTVLIPYGAKNDETGDYVTIESVNEGLDFIQDYDAVALRGVIAKAVYWDDITEPANLLAKAQQYLSQNKLIFTSLELTAVDLSAFDKSIDSFRVGDVVRVRSKPHGVDDDYKLTEQSLDFLRPARDTVTLGKTVATLTGSDAAGDRRNAQGIQKVERVVLKDYNLNVAVAMEETKATLSSLIQQTSEELRLEVSEQYATNDEVESAISTSMTQLAESFEFLFTELQTTVDANDAEAREQLTTIQKYIRFEDGNIVLGESGNELTLRIENDRISFLDDGAEVAYLSNKRLVVLDGHFLHSLQIGNFAFLPRENGNLSLTKVG